jgi:hypothetical protein
MGRSAHSRPVAFPIGRSAAASVRWATPGGAATITIKAAVATSAAIRRSAPTRPIRAAAIGPTSGASASLAILFIALATNDDPPALDHFSVDAFNDGGGISCRDLDQGMAFPEVDLADAITGNSSFAGDRSH